MAYHERNERIFVEVLRGKTYDTVAKEHGLSRERIHQIVFKLAWRYAPPHLRHFRRLYELREHADELIDMIVIHSEGNWMP